MKKYFGFISILLCAASSISSACGTNSDTNRSSELTSRQCSAKNYCEGEFMVTQYSDCRVTRASDSRCETKSCRPRTRCLGNGKMEYTDQTCHTQILLADPFQGCN